MAIVKTPACVPCFVYGAEDSEKMICLPCPIRSFKLGVLLLGVAVALYGSNASSSYSDLGLVPGDRDLSTTICSPERGEPRGDAVFECRGERPDDDSVDHSDLDEENPLLLLRALPESDPSELSLSAPPVSPNNNFGMC